jgi:hypothetical protein
MLVLISFLHEESMYDLIHQKRTRSQWWPKARFGACLAATLLLTLAAAWPQQTSQAQGKRPASLVVSLASSDNYGDIFTYDGGSLRKRTTDGRNRIPIASPDGAWIAYLSVNEIFAEALAEGANFPPATDIWLYNNATGKASIVAGQPADAIVAEDRRYISRTNPTWSPSGRQIAWAQIDFDTRGENSDMKREQVVVYDLDARTTTVIIRELPPHREINNVPIASEVAWGLPGIAVLSHIPDPSKFPEVVSVYTVDGRLLSRTGPINDSGFAYSQLIWVQDGSQYYVSNVVGDYYIDPVTAVYLEFPGDIITTPEAYSPRAPDGISLYYGQLNAAEGNPVWLIAVNGVVKTEMASSGRYYYLSGFGLAPDGKSAAYIVYPGQGTDGGLYIFRNNAKIRMNYTNVLGVSWGPVAWRLKRLPIMGG